MTETVSYGWAGKILRVDLTTRSITTEPTEPYKHYIGGMGLANKIMYDEVPAGTDPFAPENKIIFAVGPLTASGVPLAGRTTIGTLSPITEGHLVIDAHCGGMIGARIKLAGYDAVVIEGKSETPCYINVVDDAVEIKDASDVWGMGVRATTEALTRRESTRACVATIGPAGENLLPYSTIMNSLNHSAGAGCGAVMGSKNCKALVVEGNGSVQVADPQAVAELSDYMLKELIGSNNNHVVPSTQQEWAEYYDESSRWTARKGLFWGAAEGGPVETGEPKPGELNTIGYRCMKATKDLGAEAEPYTVKMGGCHGCPIHCHADMISKGAADITGMGTVGNTCTAMSIYRRFDSFLKTGLKDKESILVWNLVLGSTMDDLGLWEGYGQLWIDFGWTYSQGILEEVMSPEDWASIDWTKFYNDDPSVAVDFLKLIASNKSELSYLGHGTLVWTKRWGHEEWFKNEKCHNISPRGWAVHHGNDDSYQVGAVTNMLFNRDPMVHSATNFLRNGLPLELQKEIGAELWGSPDAVDGPDNFTPMNEYKARFCWWNVVTDVLHDSLTLCNWVWPMAASPTKARNYRGDLDMEAKFFKAVTGEDVTIDELYHRAARIMTLQRANTLRGMGTNDLRHEHDVLCDWVYDVDPDIEPFTEGTTKMEREDFQKALGMVYREFKWDEEKGCPTAETLDFYDMPDVKEELQALGLLA